jgi:hypothetical protein
MAHAMNRLAALILCALSLASPVRGAGLKAGVARVDITPPPGLPMYGYADRIRPAIGTLDPLYARVLVLEASERRLALVALDLGRVFGPASLAWLREAVRKASGISFLLITASHTHAGPNILDEYPSGEPPPWESTALEKIAGAVAEAARQMQEVRLGVNYGRVYIGYNRRRVNPDGTVTMLWQNPTRIPTAPVDPRVGVLRLDTTDGRPLAILVNYACHPVIFGPDNLRYSADFVGVMCERVEKSFDHRPLCLFLQGADGDINPYDATTPLVQDAVKKRDWTGEQLGQEAARVAAALRTETVGDRADSTSLTAPSESRGAVAGLDFAEDWLTVPVRWDAEKFRQGLLAKYGPQVFEDHADMLRDSPARRALSMAVTTVLLNKQIAFLGMPGEPFVDFQINWRDRCPVRNAFLVGYANGYYDYIPTLRAASEGGYGAGDSDTYVEPGTGERMLEHALVRVYEMLGRLSDMPEDLKE